MASTGRVEDAMKQKVNKQKSVSFNPSDFLCNIT